MPPYIAGGTSWPARQDDVLLRQLEGDLRTETRSREVRDDRLRWQTMLLGRAELRDTPDVPGEATPLNLVCPHRKQFSPAVKL